MVWWLTWRLFVLVYFVDFVVQACVFVGFVISFFRFVLMLSLLAVV